jgi:hypothetical protein
VRQKYIRPVTKKRWVTLQRFFWLGGAATNAARFSNKIKRAHEVKFCFTFAKILLARRGGNKRGPTHTKTITIHLKHHTQCGFKTSISKFQKKSISKFQRFKKIQDVVSDIQRVHFFNMRYSVDWAEK